MIAIDEECARGKFRKTQLCSPQKRGMISLEAKKGSFWGF